MSEDEKEREWLYATKQVSIIIKNDRNGNMLETIVPKDLGDEILKILGAEWYCPYRIIFKFNEGTLENVDLVGTGTFVVIGFPKGKYKDEMFRLEHFIKRIPVGFFLGSVFLMVETLAQSFNWRDYVVLPVEKK
jgi:hypothetical protein